MKKRGFTLVELLAVIAILAILVIIALPNIMSLFNNAKKESFTNEVKQLAKEAEQEWMNDSLYNTQEQVYSRCSDGTCSNGLKLTGRIELEYYIKVNKAGNIVEYYATDGTYQYRYSGSGLSLEDIKNVEQISTLSEENIISVSSNGITGGTSQNGCKIISGSINVLGSEIQCGSEHFYVLRVVNNNVRMLASKNITLSLSNPVQTDTFSPTFFSSTPYWYDESKQEIKSYYRDKDEYVYDQNSNLYQYVNKYVDILKNNGLKNVSGELISMTDINGIPLVKRRESMKRLVNIMRPEEYEQYKAQVHSLFSDDELSVFINKYSLQNIWDFNTYNDEEKAICVLYIYNLLVENGLENASEEIKQTAINDGINDFNNTYYDWLPEWVYDGKDYFSGNCSEGKYLKYPWKSDWDGGASYSDQTGYSIRPVIIVPTSEIKTN